MNTTTTTTTDAPHALDCLCGARLEFPEGCWVRCCENCGFEIRRVDFADVCGDDESDDSDYVEPDGEPDDIDDDSGYDPYTGGWSDDC